MAADIIETKIPQDIRKHKFKLGALTIRQLVCVMISIAVDAFILMVAGGIHEQSGDSIQMLIFLYVIVDLPILAFTLEPQGVRMEVYLKQVLFYALFAPSKRINSHSFKSKDKKPKQKKSKKELVAMLKEHPEYKAYL